MASNFREKENYFNKYFASECPISEDVINPSVCFFTFSFTDDDILKINKDLSKAHGFDEIYVRIIIICNDAIIEPLSLIYENCIENGTFPATWIIKYYSCS